ncbi:type 2 lanthipeptide synthetase LanM family protein [Paenibacillus ginsengarvi]|uniref:Type 2 lantipeptide synthetase LanM n=1 Tax=Paenibacillus ginsengarvi TaxID=400777 RepID=A0A3B0AUH7_9BACL|nr:type 2 lanthipeptide synthetase LanM family protein [Paenibacillus ginsengarvi]RKN64183.1 type 2 lantipeptide synthetase LanM [Paenibacillus ginsengarvi]
MMIKDCNIINAAYLHEREIQDTNEGIAAASENTERWRKRTGLVSDDLFTLRLNKENLNEAEFAAILDHTKYFTLKQQPKWAATLQAILNGKEVQDDEAASLPILPFSSFIQPFLLWMRRTLLDRFQQWEMQGQSVPVNRSALLEDVVSSLSQTLTRVADRTLIAELHLAKQAHELKGKSPEERFQYFVAHRLSAYPDILVILHKYPVLGRLLTELTEKHTAHIIELLERFQKDKEELERLWQKDFSWIVGCKRSGDTHQGGKSVTILHFASGSRLLYKPRSLDLDKKFQELLQWVNRHGAQPRLPVMKVVNKHDYGWSEYIHHQPCSTDDQINRFYQRHGQYLALLYLLQGADFHHENVIASGEFPYLVDLELLFHRYSASLESSVNSDTAVQKASDWMVESVLRTGLLPSYRLRFGSFEGLETSGIGAYSGQLFKTATIQYQNPGTDEMRLVRVENANFQTGNNRPILEGTEAKAEAYTGDIIAGFNHMYYLLTAHQESMGSPDGPIANFAFCPVRVLLRNTDVYGQMLQASLQPGHLANGLARVELFDFMWRIVETVPVLAAAVHSECADLLEHDIPYFSSTVNSRDVWDSRGNRISGFFPNDGLSVSMDRIRRLGEEDRKRQVAIIRSSMLTLLRSWENPSFHSPAASDEIAVCRRDSFKAGAIEIADRLAASSIWGGHRDSVTWIGTGRDSSGMLRYAPMDSGIYNGTLGMALFYAYMAQETGAFHYRTLAEGAVQTSLEFLRFPGAVAGGSVFYGLASYLYAFSHLAPLMGDPSLLETAVQLLPRFDRLIEEDKKLDLMSGSAGILLGCLRLHERTGEPEALAVARKCADHLLTHQVAAATGIGWRTSLTNHRMLAGFSHGASGYAAALAQLAAATGDERYMDAAAGAIRYERSLFDKPEGNWRDLRADEPLAANPVYWCHGAPGVLLSRLLVNPYCRDAQFHDEIQIALQTTLKRWRGTSNCLCHGDMGNLDVLLVCAKAMNDASLYEQVYHRASQSLDYARKHGWQCDVPAQADAPGFMVGLAGIGYALLRLSNPELPSILALQQAEASVATGSVRR